MEIIFDKNGFDFLREKVSHSQDRNIEFELRFGKIDDKKFQPSLFPQETINRIRDYVENTLRLKKISSVTTVHIMDNKIRQVIDDKGFSYFERKEAISHHDINYNDFTLRMSLSKEDKISPPTTLSKIIETRMRKRDEFKWGPYTYVFTTITKKMDDETLKTFDEFEIEVTPFGNAEENVKNVVSAILPFIAEDKVNRYLPINTQNAIRNAYKSFEAKPRNLERTDIITIRTKEYSVTNKLDGERFMIVLNDKGLYAVNKRLVDHIEKESFRSTTILDTELFGGIFHVFDCMMYKGQDITMQKHDYRLTCASEISSELDIMYSYRKYKYKYTTMKVFSTIQGTQDLLTDLHSNSVRYENNDGIIYTPNDIYRSNNIYKWKFPEKMSIDFKVRLIQRPIPYTYELQLYDKGNVLYDFRGSKMFPLLEEKARFISDQPLIDGGIYEFKYENEKFVMMRRRADKVLPNFRTTGESVWNDIKDPFTEKELLELLYDKNLEELPVANKELNKEEAFKKYREYHNLIKDELIQRYCKHKTILDLGSGRGGDLGKYGKANIEYLWAVEPFKDNYDEFKRRLKDTYKNLQKKTVLIETGAQSTKKITDVMGRHKADVITSFFSLSFFFFEDTSDLKKLVRTIAASLKVGGIFIGTTIDGDRTEALLHKKSPFEFDGGYLKWIHHQNVEVYMDGIVGTQTESLVNFQLLVEELQKYDIILERTEFFKENLDLTPSLKDLNSLYRTFVFRRNPSTNIDTIIRSESDEGQSLIDFVFKRLTISDHSTCFEAFKILCKIPKNIGNRIFEFVFDFPSDEKYSAKFVNDMKEFENGYTYINPFIKYNQSLNFAKTYGCIKSPKSYLLVTSSCKPLSDSTYVNHDYIMISIVLQLYYSLLALSHENGYFTKITSLNICFHKRSDIKKIIYDDGAVVDIIDGVVLVFNGYENYTQTFDKPYDISLPMIFNGLSISSIFKSVIDRIKPSTIEESIKTFNHLIIESYDKELLRLSLPSLYTSRGKEKLIGDLYKSRKNELLSYLRRLYINQSKHFEQDKVEKMLENESDNTILTFLRKELSYKRDVEKDIAFAQKRGQTRALDIKDLLIKGGITDHITSYMDFGGADGSITSIVAKEFKIPAEKTLCVDLESWGNMHHDKTRDLYEEKITFVPVTEGDTEIPLPDENVMFITSLQVLHHMPDPKHTIDEFYRVLKPGGVVFLREHDSEQEDDNKMFDLIHILYEIVLTEEPNWSYMDGPQPFYRSSKEWRQMFEKAGFKSVIATQPSMKDSNRVFHEVFIKEKVSSPPLLLPPSDDDSSSISAHDSSSDDSSSDDSSSDEDDEDDEDDDGKCYDDYEDYKKCEKQEEDEDITPFYGYPISTRFENTRRFMRGIYNVGNSCYMNSALQSIVTALPIMQFFCNIDIKNIHINVNTVTKGRLVSAFSKIVCKLTTVDTVQPIPKHQIMCIKSILGKLDKRFKKCKQEDSSEFIGRILDGLHEELSSSDGNSFIKELFGSIYTSKMKSLKKGCDHTKKQTESGISPLILNLDKNTKTIDEALRKYSSIQEIDGNQCDQCESKHSFNKKTVISHAPEILVVTFARFQTGFKNGKYVSSRLNNALSFPEDLIITQENADDEGTSEISYSLYAIVNQMGSLQGGHYTANIKNEDGWWICNDEDVENVKNKSKLLKDNKNAYVLFYHRKN